MQSLPNLTLAQIYPQVSGDTNLNCCGDPDCGNYGIEPAPTKHAFVGRGAAEKRLKAAMADPAIARGVGRYRIASEGDETSHRETDGFEFEDDPRAWSDGRVLVCQHLRGNSECGVQSKLLSNDAFEEERNRLLTQNGALEGPICGNCGTSYLEAPHEFAFNGANGKPSRKVGHKKGSEPRARSVRLIHKPCKGLSGARFTVSSEHRRQKKRDENIQILSMIANGAGIHDMRRILRSPRGETEPGMSRLYDRIFWLERTLLAYEQAQLAQWRKRVEKKAIKDGKPYTHTRIAHDDIVVGVNWQTKIDRKITQLNCAVSADIKSGYVFRCDVDFDPTVDPLEVVEDAYFGVAQGATLRKQYRNAEGTFTAPLMHFQRPTGRFDEPALFAAAEKQLRHFVSRTAKAFDAKGESLTNEAYHAINQTSKRADDIEYLREHWYNFVKHERDSRNSFDGIMTRDTYTKAASLACLKLMVPTGKITLVGEQEAAMARVVPHIFREEILADLFEWAVVGFNKEAPIGLIETRQAEFRDSFQEWRNMHPDLERWEALASWASANLKPAIKKARNGSVSPWPGPNFASNAFPKLWISSPVQVANEIDKKVGFPILSPRYRETYRKMGFNDQINDPELRAAITRRVLMATLQPASTYMNAIRERVSIIQRAGGRSARKGPSYINGAAYSPRVLIALMNIWRVHYNFFDWRTYQSPVDPDKTDDAEGARENATPRMRQLSVPGTSKKIFVPLRRGTHAKRTTPAMRMGVLAPSAPRKRSDKETSVDAATKPPQNKPGSEMTASSARAKSDRRQDDRPYLPDLSRILYQPWLFHGTPMWAKLQGR